VPFCSAVPSLGGACVDPDGLALGYVNLAWECVDLAWECVGLA
jgi:hypothetical protein